MLCRPAKKISMVKPRPPQTVTTMMAGSTVFWSASQGCCRLSRPIAPSNRLSVPMFGS